MMVASGPLVTMAEAVPKMAPTLARTVLAYVPAVLPAVKTPVDELMEPPPATIDQVGVMGTTLP